MSLRTNVLLGAAVVGALVAGPSESASAACGLDTSFGTGGVLTAPDYTVDFGNAVAVDAQGRYLLAGEGGRSLAIMRLLPSGDLDTSFGSGGLVTVRHDDVYSSEAWDVTPLTDGRIAVAGRAYWAVSPTSWGDIAIAVLNPDGSRDTGFGGGDGVIYLDIEGHNDAARSIDVDAQGRIVVGGSTDAGSGASNAVLARLLPDGTLDPTFGTDGFAVQHLGGSYESAYGIDVMADGRIVAAGSWQADFMRPWLGRFLTDGRLDASFGQAGLVLPPDPGAWHDVAAGPRSSVFVGGSEGLELVVARYTSSGSVDRSYGAGDGKTLVALGPWDPYPSAHGLAVFADGSVLAAGSATRTGYSEGVIVRLDPRGMLVRSFGTGGVIRYSEDPQYSSSSFSSAAVLAGGGAVVAGTGFAGAILARTC